jgi:hypothetical protein
MNWKFWKKELRTIEELESFVNEEQFNDLWLSAFLTKKEVRALLPDYFDDENYYCVYEQLIARIWFPEEAA